MDPYSDSHSVGGRIDAGCYVTRSMAATYPLSFDSRFRLAAAALAALPCLATLFTFNPADSSVFPPCPFRALTGFHCPGCGTLRGLHQLLHGHLLEAFSFNPLMVLFLPFPRLRAAVQRHVLGRRTALIGIPAAGNRNLAAAGGNYSVLDSTVRTHLPLLPRWRLKGSSHYQQR